MTELVSILIPAYNAERFIVDTLNSALSQTWLLHKEIIIVDEGSIHRTLQKAKQFEAENYPANHGASVARNTALHYVQGNYIPLLESMTSLPLISSNNSSAIQKTAVSLRVKDGQVDENYRTQHVRSSSSEFSMADYFRRCHAGNATLRCAKFIVQQIYRFVFLTKLLKSQGCLSEK